MKRHIRYVFFGIMIFFSMSMNLYAGEHSLEKRIVVTPIIDLILNPWRYDERVIQTYGFTVKRDRTWYLVPFRDNLDFFDPSSCVHLDTSRISDESIDWLDRAHVVVFGKVRLGGKKREFPGEVSKNIDVTRVAIIGNPKLYWKELDMDPTLKDED